MVDVHNDIITRGVQACCSAVSFMSNFVDATSWLGWHTLMSVHNFALAACVTKHMSCNFCCPCHLNYLTVMHRL